MSGIQRNTGTRRNVIRSKCNLEEPIVENDNEKTRKNKQDLDRIRQILRDIADKLARANKSLKNSQPHVSSAHSKRAEDAAEKLRSALEQLKKSRKEASLNNLDGAACELPKKRSMQPEQTGEYGLPVFRGDFVSADEERRLTGLPPITDDEIASTNWDDIWNHIQQFIGCKKIFLCQS